jgi:hypothetical protein
VRSLAAGDSAGVCGGTIATARGAAPQPLADRALARAADVAAALGL